MCARTLALLWLVGAFHSSGPRKSRAEKIPVYAGLPGVPGGPARIACRCLLSPRTVPPRVVGTEPLGRPRNILATPLSLFLALCVNTPATGHRAPGGRWYIRRPRVSSRRSPPNPTYGAPGRSRLALPAQPEPLPAWRSIQSDLRSLVGDSTYEIWLAPLTLRSWDGDVLELEAPAATRAWVSDRFGRVLERCAKDALGDQASVTLAGSERTPRRSSTGSPPGSPTRPSLTPPRWLASIPATASSSS